MRVLANQNVAFVLTAAAFLFVGAVVAGLI